jgi:hypothetical protein
VRSSCAAVAAKRERSAASASAREIIHTTPATTHDRRRRHMRAPARPFDRRAARAMQRRAVDRSTFADRCQQPLRPLTRRRPDAAQRDETRRAPDRDGAPLQIGDANVDRLPWHRQRWCRALRLQLDVQVPRIHVLREDRRIEVL